MSAEEGKGLPEPEVKGDNAPDYEGGGPAAEGEELGEGTLNMDQPVSREPGPFTLVALIFCILFFCAGVVLIGITRHRNEEAEDSETDGPNKHHWLDRDDSFHPSSVALEGRWFDEYVYRSGYNNRPARHNRGMPFLSPFKDNSCICRWEKYRMWIEPQWCRDHQKHNQTDANGVLIDPEAAFAECTYTVPYLVLWIAMTCAFFGLAAVAFHAHGVLSMTRGTQAMSDLSGDIADSSMVFLEREYTWLLPFVLAVWIFLFTAVDGQEHDWRPDTSVSFLMGAIFSAGCGYMGMIISTEGNCRTAAACATAEGFDGLSAGLKVAFKAGACMGLGVVSFGILGLAASYAAWGNTQAMGGFGFGASCVALFARVGGGIYTKAADVGGDLCGKVEAGLNEDNPRNPATIADCVGDNVGDVAGMGADLFESFVGSIVAACVLGASEFGEYGVALPFYLASIGLVVSVFCTLYVYVPNSEGGGSLEDLLMALTYNVVIAGIFIVVIDLMLCLFWLEPISDYMDTTEAKFSNSQPGCRLFGCVAVGLLSGIIIGKVTEYFTAHTFQPTQSIAKSGEYGPGPVVIQGLGVGMYSTVVPMCTIIACVLGSYYLAGLYGIAIACVGMLSTLGVTMSTDAYGPVSDNAGGIAEMCSDARFTGDSEPLPEWVRDSTDKLDALGNTTAATGKGFSNGSAVLAALTLLAAFARSANVKSVDLLQPVTVVGILLGALQPYIFSAMTMLSVNKAAQEMMTEVRRQFAEITDSEGRKLTDANYNGVKPDYAECVRISTESSLREMLMPGILAVFSPLVIGFMFGSHSLVGFLLGAIGSGYLLGVQMSNTGGAWDNAKKWTEAGDRSNPHTITENGLRLKGVLRPKKSMEHAAVVVGDTIGDPFKDTSGPSLNILIKLMTQFSFVIGPLLDQGWRWWYVGLICLGVMILLFSFVQFSLLAKEEKEEDYYEEDGPGIIEKLDFIDAQSRRIGNEKNKLMAEREWLKDTYLKSIKENPATAEVYERWAAKKGTVPALPSGQVTGKVQV